MNLIGNHISRGFSRSSNRQRTAGLHRLLACVMAIFFASISAISLAQTGPVMFALPWEKDTDAEINGSATLFGNSAIIGSNENFKMDVYHSAGRWRILGDRQETPVLGFDYRHIRMHSDNSAVPDQLVNVVGSAGMPIALINKEWFVITIGGLGYAGNTPFADSNAWYTQSTLLVGKFFSKDRSLIFGLDYDGNRSIFPDVPLPGFAYRDVYNPQLRYLVGVPLTGLEYHPGDQITINIGVRIPKRLEASVQWKPTDHLAVYADYNDRTEAFHVQGQDELQRLYFNQQRVEAGVNFFPLKTQDARLTAAMGYAFGQSFSTGFSTLNDEIKQKLKDEPYVRFAFLLRF